MVSAPELIVVCEELVKVGVKAHVSPHIVVRVGIAMLTVASPTL